MTKSIEMTNVSATSVTDLFTKVVVSIAIFKSISFGSSFPDNVNK